MTTCLDLLGQLRAQRRATVRALNSLPDDKLTISLGPQGAGDVRATILSLAQDDDRRCVLLGEIFTDVGWRPSEAQPAPHPTGARGGGACGRAPARAGDAGPSVAVRGVGRRAP